MFHVCAQILSPYGFNSMTYVSLRTNGIKIHVHKAVLQSWRKRFGLTAVSSTAFFKIKSNSIK